MRKCLDCPRMIASGSRCPVCKERHRPSYARGPLPQAVKRRDGYRCRECGRGPREGVRVIAHHIRPIAAGGEHSPRNLITLCDACHRAAHQAEAV